MPNCSWPAHTQWLTFTLMAYFAIHSHISGAHTHIVKFTVATAALCNSSLSRCAHHNVSVVPMARIECTYIK